jgi:hypothetical protein
MNSCRKTHRECAGAELIGKGGGKLDSKGIMTTGGDCHCCVAKISEVYGWISM